MAEVNTYYVSHYGTATGTLNIAAHIYLYNATTGMLGYINFLKDGVVTPPDQINANGVYGIYMPYSSLANVIDTLRNEKPLYLYWASAAGYAYLSTSSEPVGEGE
jgi:hypothetical protein